MKTVKVEVKSARVKDANGQRKVVATIEHPEYDTLDEAIKNLSEPIALKLLNAQVATNAKNKARAEAVGVPSEKALRDEAFMRIVTNPEWQGKIASAAGDTVRFEAVVSEMVDIIKKEKGISDEDTDTTEA